MKLKSFLNQPFQLVAFNAALPTPKGDELPDRLLVLKWGTSQTNKGTFVCNATTLSQLPGLQKQAKFDRVALDFNHNSVPGAPAYKGEPLEVAAYGTPEVVDGEGVYLTALEWTPQGRKAALDGHYPDLSPTILHNKKGEVVFLHSAALARQGEIDGLTLFSANIPQLKYFTMDFKKLLLTILGLAEDADDAAIESAATAFADKEGKEEASPELKAMSAELESLKATVAKLSGSDEGRERAAIVSKATSEGKVIPLSADDINKLPLTILSAMVEKLDVTIPLDRRTPVTLSADAKALDTSVADTLNRMGLTKEDYEKYGPKA